MASVRIWQKRKLVLNPLNFAQRDMLEIGSAGLLSVFQRLAAARGPTDAPAKPLTRRYAMYKRHFRAPVRNLYLTGQMLGSLKIRTVSDNKVTSAPDGRLRAESRKIKKSSGKARPTNKIVGWANQKREPWLVLSPANRKVTIDKAKIVLARAKERILRWGNIR